MKKCLACGLVVDDAANFCTQDGEASWDYLVGLVRSPEPTYTALPPLQPVATPRVIEEAAEPGPVLPDVTPVAEETSAHVAPPTQRHETHHNRRKAGHR